MLLAARVQAVYRLPPGPFRWVCHSTTDGVYERIRARDLHSDYVAAVCAGR